MKRIFLVIVLISFSFSLHTSAFTGQIIQRGAFGDDVIELQARLQYLSYYDRRFFYQLVPVMQFYPYHLHLF